LWFPEQRPNVRVLLPSKRVVGPAGEITVQTVQNGVGREFSPTLPNLLRAAGESFADRDFIASDDGRLSFAEAEETSRAWAKGLLGLGVGKGTRVGLLMPNNADWVLAFFAATRVGALCAAMSTFYQAPELAWALRHNDIDTLLISDRYLSHDYLERLERALPGLAAHTSPELYLPSHPYLRRIVVWGDCERPWALKGPDALLGAVTARPQIDDAFLEQVEANVVPADSLIIILTSGSTAEPKAVVHSHGTAVRAVHQFINYIDIRPEDRSYTGQPLFWIGGLAMNLLPSMFMGSTVCFSQTPAPADVTEMVLRERVTRLTLWPAQISALLEHARSKGLKLESVRLGIGAPVDEAGMRIPKERRNLGPLGMTETFGMHSIEKFTSAAPPGKAGNWGRHLPSVRRRVVDPQTGREAAPNAIGELHVRGRTLMKGYYKREREDTFLPDGFFATGDLVSIDEDDYLYFHGRGSEMIKTSGANVSPREVELALQMLDGVQEAIVFGIDHPTKGEIVAAYVVPAPDAVLDAGKLRDALRSEVSPYKVPQQIRSIAYDEVPRTASQKVLKPQLKQRFIAEMQGDRDPSTGAHGRAIVRRFAGAGDQVE
jgi:acyl-CoA synthetase (AMP-forming)/AMP-acid ligase II